MLLKFPKNSDNIAKNPKICRKCFFRFRLFLFPCKPEFIVCQIKFKNTGPVPEKIVQQVPSSKTNASSCSLRYDAFFT